MGGLTHIVVGPGISNSSADEEFESNASDNSL